MRNVCSAVNRMFMAYGLLCGPADPTDRAAKAKSYETLRQLAEGIRGAQRLTHLPSAAGRDPFKPQPPEPRTDGYYKKRPCPEMVYCAADILEVSIKEG